MSMVSHFYVSIIMWFAIFSYTYQSPCFLSFIFLSNTLFVSFAHLALGNLSTYQIYEHLVNKLLHGFSLKIFIRLVVSSMKKFEVLCRQIYNTVLKADDVFKLDDLLAGLFQRRPLNQEGKGWEKLG